MGDALAPGPRSSFPRYWTAAAISSFGSAVTAVAMPVPVVQLLGAFSVFGFAATQSLLPRLLPRARLVSANARLDQADAAAQTFGPAIGGGLVGLLGAPVTIAIDAISYLIDAALNASIRVDEPRPDSRTRNLRAEIRAGLQWTYRHRTLGPLAASTHVWFLANGAAMTVLSLLALRSLGFTAYTFGMLLTVFGITSLVGAPPPSMRLKPAPGVSKHLAVSSVRPPTTSRPDIESCPASNELAASAIDSAAYGS